MGGNLLETSGEFVVTQQLEKLVQRSLSYLKAGFPIHFQGPSGTGKTALAIHLARCLNRPTMMIHGDADLTSSDIVGGLYGYKHSLYYDNFVHSVLKQREDWERQWIMGRLTEACKNGMTLIYDEFTRSHPETNNALLSVLEEGVLQLTGIREGDKYIRVHPEFRAIFTSNPEEYAGVYKSQDALRDRLITIELGQMDLKTEVRIACVKSGLDEATALKLVSIVRLFANSYPALKATLRRSIMLAKLVKNLQVPLESSLFREICFDLLGSELSRKGNSQIQPVAVQRKLSEVISSVLKEH